MGAGHDHSHAQPVQMVMGDNGQVQQPEQPQVDFDAVSGYYSGQIALLHERVAFLVGQLSATTQEKTALQQELVRVNNELHELKSGEKPKAKPIKDNPQA